MAAWIRHSCARTKLFAFLCKSNLYTTGWEKHVNVSSLATRSSCQKVESIIAQWIWSDCPQVIICREKKNTGRSFTHIIFHLQTPGECSQQVIMKNTGVHVSSIEKKGKYPETRFHAPVGIAGDVQYLHLPPPPAPASGLSNLSEGGEELIIIVISCSWSKRDKAGGWLGERSAGKSLCSAFHL